MPARNRFSRRASSPSAHATFGALACASIAPCVHAAILDANPANYQTLVSNLVAGDTLRLASGSYEHGLVLAEKAGTAMQPIVIVGPADHSAKVRAEACCEVVRLDGASFIQLRNLTLEVDSTGVQSSGRSDHVTLENLRILGNGRGAHTAGIVTQGPASEWVIRRDMIARVERGLSLGNPDGSALFVDGLIEYNVVVDTTRADVEIAGATGTRKTLIRHNAFSDDADTLMSAVSGNAYEIYGNVFYTKSRSGPLSSSAVAGMRDNVLMGDVTSNSPNLYVQAANQANGMQWTIAAVSAAAVTPTVTLTASPTNVSSGGTSLLSWTSTGATGCAASGGWSGTKAANGAETVGPIRTSTDYQLTCLGEGGNAGAMVTVTVGGSAPSPTPSPTPAPTPTPTPTPTPSPTPSPTPTPTPTPTPSPTPTPTPTPTPPMGSASSGGGGALDISWIAILLLIVTLRQRAPQLPSHDASRLARERG